MKRISSGSFTIWHILLLVSIIFAAFILPVLPLEWQRGSFRIVYSILYISAIFSLEKRSNYILALFFSTILMEWISGMFNLQIMLLISKGINIIFFLVIVVSLIWQIAKSRRVTAKDILGSIAGYLLLGIIYSLFVAIILQHDPSAFTSQQTESPTEAGINASVPLYYGYVTLATLGYGDIVPLKPYSRSLATWIAISGQFYIAIIVALLVGKFAARRNSDEPTDPND